MGKKKPPPPPPVCEPSGSLTESPEEEASQERDPEVLAGALVKVARTLNEEEEVNESPALFPPRPPKPNHLSRSSSMKPSTSSSTPVISLAPPPIPPKTYKKNYGYSS